MCRDHQTSWLSHSSDSEAFGDTTYIGFKAMRKYHHEKGQRRVLSLYSQLRDDPKALGENETIYHLNQPGTGNKTKI